MKDTMKRILSLVLCAVMVLGFLPVNVFAAETVLDAAIFCSDVHGSSSDLTSVMAGIKNSGVTYSSIGFVGDTALSVANTESAVNSGLGYTPKVMFSYAASHDTENSADISTNWDYSGEVEDVSDYYLVYTIRETDMQNNTTAEANFTTWYSGLTDAQKQLPIFIMSHRPLHARRNDNANAADWYEVISAAAETSDIVFFWAHNHTGEDSVDTAAYYVAKNGSETIEVYNGDTVVPNFTYMNAGYINANNQEPARINVATTVQITADSLIFQDYTTSGAYSGEYAHNVTVARDAVSTDSGDDGSTDSGDSDEDSSTEGEEEGGTTTTTTTYNYTATANTDGTGYILVSNGYALQNNDGTIGAVAVTVSDDGSTVTFDDSVDVSTILWTIDSDGDVMNNGYYLLRASGSGTKSMTISTTDSGDAYSNWTYSSDTLTTTGGSGGSTTFYAYCTDGTFSTQSSSSQELKFYVPTETETAVTLSSISITGTSVYNVGAELDVAVIATYTDGNTADVTTGAELTGYDMSTAGAQTVTATYTEDGVTKTATFTITVNESISETATVTGIEVSGAQTEYTLGDTLSTEGMVVTATYDDNGTTKTKVLSADEYTVSEVDMTTEGEKTVTVSYTFNDTTVTDTYTVTVTEAPSNEVTLGGTVTTKKTVYVLTSSISAGNSYLIVNSNSAGSYYALANNSGSVAATGVTVAEDDTIGTYIELTDATDELWTVGSGYTFQNGSYYLGYTSSGNGWEQSYSFGLSTTSRNWSYSSNRLSTSVTSNNRNTTYYLRYNDGWTWTNSNNSSGRSVYFYIPTEIETTTDTTVTYTMRAEDLKQVVDSTNADTMTASLDYCLQGNGTDLTTLPSGGEYRFTVLSGSDIISVDENGSVNFSGTYGTATVKVAYTWTQDGETYTVYKNVTVEATEPYYSLDLYSAVYTFTEADVSGSFDSDKSYYVKNDDGSYSLTTDTAPVDGTTYYTVSVTAGEEITTTVAIKGVEAGDTYSTWAIIKYYDGTTEDGEDLGDIDDTLIEWTSSDTSIATVDPSTGIITFTGKEGTVNITATYLNGNKPFDTITISVTQSNYSVPSDGTSDFPEYPNEGAIRFDKTATAVGNFSQTGIAQVELSMTGVPYTTGSEIDVVIMLDQSTSMDSTRIAATVAATKVFIESIVKNADGSYNGNRVYVGYFNGDSTYDITDSANIGGTLASIDSDTELEALYSDLESEFDGSPTASGTNYDVSLERCDTLLTNARTDGTGNDRAQFCVFMSDGGPTDYATDESTVISESTIVNYFSVGTAGSTSVDTSSFSNTLPAEYWSTQMKNDGVKIYSVGLILQEQPTSGPQTYRSYSDDQYYYITKTILTGISSGEDYFFNCESSTDTDEMEGIFADIAVSILQAATDITVEDQITDEYTMIFDIPTDTNYDHTISTTQEFYIEFLKYTLDENHERTTETSVTKLYLKNTNGVYSAASDSTGTAYAAPGFEQTTIGDKGTLYYWTTDGTMAGKAAVSYTSGSTTYYFIPYGQEANEDGTAPDGWYNMTSGAYAYGTVDSVTNTSTDLVIATPYFVYNASTRMIYWTVDKLDTYEYALRYFLYLDDSATDIGETTETDAGPYPTNDHAYLTYTNFRGNECQQKFPVPQMTWAGAQVSYVFYLVNSAGQPINKSGQVVDFANAVFVTDIYTKSVVWNKSGDTSTGTGDLSADWLASDLLPDDYIIYDEAARYVLNVYQNADGTTIKNDFTIFGGTAANISSSLNTRLDLETTESTVSVETTKVYNTKAGKKISTYGTYDSATLTDIDFANTTVAFAVVWEAKLVEDVVVVDYGLDVLINVVQNDLMQNTISGIGVGNSAYGSIAMNTGVSNDAKLGNSSLEIDENTITIENENQIRFHQGDMEFAEPVEFFYESPVGFYENSEKKEGFMYSSVTVIPATTIYYEDEYVELSIWDMDDNELDEEWAVVGTTVDGTQAQDRPGASKISSDLDADNNYGYDGAYTECSEFSMGSARKVTVDKTRYAEAQFTFYGTGFDIISLTSNTTGTISVDVYDAAEFAAAPYGTTVYSTMVDTYYGYTQDADGNWIVDTTAKNSLYQVPVIKVSGLDYDKYTVVITVAYYTGFDHQDAGSLDFYLDAIRIYDPTGNQNDDANDAYLKDQEAWPVYQELRNNVIASADDAGQIAGAVYIDGAADDVYKVADYSSYGPNNELYLEPGQAIAFSLNLASLTTLDALQIAMKSANGSDVSYVIFDSAAIADQTDVEALKTRTIATSTDLYYDMTDLLGCEKVSELTDSTIVIMNISENDAILSITNLKATFTADPGDVTIPFSVVDSKALNALLTALNTEESVEEESPESTESTDSTEGSESTDPTEDSESTESTEGEDNSGSSSTIGKIIDWLRKLLGLN